MLKEPKGRLTAQAYWTYMHDGVSCLGNECGAMLTGRHVDTVSD